MSRGKLVPFGTRRLKWCQVCVLVALRTAKEPVLVRQIARVTGLHVGTIYECLIRMSDLVVRLVGGYYRLTKPGRMLLKL